MPLDYCKLTEREILHKSPIFQAIRQQTMPQDLQRRDAGVGSGGNCGIFAEELWNHHCMKGKIYGIFNDVEPEMAFHVMLRIDDCLVDAGGVYCPKQGQKFSDIAKEFADQWAFSGDLFTEGFADSTVEAFQNEYGEDIYSPNVSIAKKRSFINPQMIPLQFNNEDDLHVQLVSRLTEPTIDNEEIADIFREIDP